MRHGGSNPKRRTSLDIGVERLEHMDAAERLSE